MPGELTGGKLHHNADELLCEEDLLELNDVWVAEHPVV